jgi:hypothetical protein
MNEWRPDPHGRFQHRLFVDGVPTTTVHDGQRQLSDATLASAMPPPPPLPPRPPMPSFNPPAFGAPTAARLAPAPFAPPSVPLTPGAAYAPAATAVQTLPATQWHGYGLSDAIGWADVHAGEALAVPGGFGGGVGVGRAPRQPMRVTLKNKELVVDDRAIALATKSLAFSEIDSVQYRENSGAVYVGRALVLAVGLVIGVAVVEHGSSCPTLTFSGAGRKVTVAMPLSGKARANSAEAYTMLADALNHDILPNAAAAIAARLRDGQPMQMAGRTITSQGMMGKKGLLPWSTLRATAIAKGQVEFAFSGGSVKVSASKANAFVLAAVAEAMQGRRLRLPGSIASSSKSSKAHGKTASRKATMIVCGLAAAVAIACVVLLKFG